MKLSAPVSVKLLSTLTSSELIGNSSLEITGVNEIHQVESGDIVFVDHPKYYDTCLHSAATCIIINNKDVTIPEGKALLYCEDPFEAYIKIVQHFKPLQLSDKAIHETAIIGEGTVIMPHVFIGANVMTVFACIITSSPIIVSANMLTLG